MTMKSQLVVDAISEFLSEPENRKTTYPMNGLPQTEGELTEDEKAFLSKSTLETLRDQV